MLTLRPRERPLTRLPCLPLGPPLRWLPKRHLHRQNRPQRLFVPNLSPRLKNGGSFSLAKTKVQLYSTLYWRNGPLAPQNNKKQVKPERSDRRVSAPGEATGQVANESAVKVGVPWPEKAPKHTKKKTCYTRVPRTHPPTKRPLVMRRRMSSSKSRRNFKRNAGTHPKNNRSPNQRGGYRL